MNSATQMMLNSQVRRHQAELSRWVGQVRTARTPLEAARTAAHPPTRPSLLSSARVLVSSDENRARQQVERLLEDRLAQVDGDDKQMVPLLRLLQGHWPRLYNDLRKLHHKTN